MCGGESEGLHIVLERSKNVMMVPHLAPQVHPFAATLSRRYRWSGLSMIDKAIAEIVNSAKDDYGGRLPEQEGIEYAG